MTADTTATTPLTGAGRREWTGLAVLALPTLIVGSAPPERAGSAASMSESSGELGIALGVATLGSLSAAVYRDELDRTLPAGLPADAATQARDGLAGAVSAAGELPAATGAALVDGARAAYTGGLTVTATNGAVLLLALAAVAALAFRSIRPYASREQPADSNEPTR
ncbi:hypothetical protein [Micromonospora kangleipakensis]|uniref:hypothetical protein n=1 Tax=Micromonospora kangleipakensis TaxID=1077942 RepID=UPI001028AC54|nr:hypothetical protein [Micromonospora kangleipakensis]